eukprot:m.339079 g.339079  ORF g.339079 m.339079 type:complete len:137 (+) comp18652_c0_seq1:113-523(+)
MATKAKEEAGPAVTEDKESKKDEIIVVNDTDAETELLEEAGEMGAVGPDGQIDWDCPCLQGMTEGPCGEAFKEAFSCFVYSKEEPKGSDCMEEFKAMHDCIQNNQDYYKNDEEEEEEDQKEEKEQESEKSEKKTTA